MAALSPAKCAPSNLTARWSRCASIALALFLPSVAAHAAAPEIRTSAINVVPACVTPQRLMFFLKRRNRNLNPRFADIAAWYKRHGDAWRVRWDYAFFQMAVETNFLTYKRGNGRWGDVRPRHNNFAALGTTGGGVPGDSYADVSTGVLAQIQHLVVYSGERIANPVGARTRLKQNDILLSTADLKGHTTFSDLSRRWAVDKHYGRSIEWVAKRYRAAYCSNMASKTVPNAKTTADPAKTLPPAALGGPSARAGTTTLTPVRTIWSRATQVIRPPVPVKATAPRTQVKATAVASAAAPTATRKTPAQTRQDLQRASTLRPAAISSPAKANSTVKLTAQSNATVSDAPRAFAFATAMNRTASPVSPTPQPVIASRKCRVFSASYGGKKTLLVRAQTAREVQFTVLTVLDGFERSMLANYVTAHAPGGSSLGEFETRDAALARARKLCPGAARALQAEGASAG